MQAHLRHHHHHKRHHAYPMFLLTLFTLVFCAHLIITTHIRPCNAQQSPSLASSYLPSHVHDMIKQQYGGALSANSMMMTKDTHYCTSDLQCFNSGTCDVSTGICQCIPGFKNDIAHGVYNCSLIGTSTLQHYNTIYSHHIIIIITHSFISSSLHRTKTYGKTCIYKI